MERWELHWGGVQWKRGNKGGSIDYHWHTKERTTKKYHKKQPKTTTTTQDHVPPHTPPPPPTYIKVECMRKTLGCTPKQGPCRGHRVFRKRKHQLCNTIMKVGLEFTSCPCYTVLKCQTAIIDKQLCHFFQLITCLWGGVGVGAWGLGGGGGCTEVGVHVNVYMCTQACMSLCTQQYTHLYMYTHTLAITHILHPHTITHTTTHNHTQSHTTTHNHTQSTPL